MDIFDVWDIIETQISNGIKTMGFDFHYGYPVGTVILVSIIYIVIMFKVYNYMIEFLKIILYWATFAVITFIPAIYAYKKISTEIDDSRL